MKTLKAADGDLVIENGEFVMVEGDDEKVQAMEMLLKIREDEFELDETIGLKRDNILSKQLNEEDALMDVLVALQPLTDEKIIDGIEDILFEKDATSRTLNVSLTASTPNGAIKAEGVGV